MYFIMNAIGIKSNHKLQRALGMKHAHRIHALGMKQNPAIAVTDFALGENHAINDIYKHASNSGNNTYLPLGLKHKMEHKMEKVKMNSLERKHK